MFTLNGGAVSWSSSKQSVVVGSTCEAEYIAASEAANEGVWMKEFITDLCVIPSSMSSPTSLFNHCVMHHPATNSLVTFIARLIGMCITERAQRYLSDNRSDKS